VVLTGEGSQDFSVLTNLLRSEWAKDEKRLQQDLLTEEK
jgi:hypothetical protein